MLHARSFNVPFSISPYKRLRHITDRLRVSHEATTHIFGNTNRNDRRYLIHLTTSVPRDMAINIRTMNQHLHPPTMLPKPEIKQNSSPKTPKLTSARSSQSPQATKPPKLGPMPPGRAASDAAGKVANDLQESEHHELHTNRCSEQE